jgi:hypothetical protein
LSHFDPQFVRRDTSVWKQAQPAVADTRKLRCILGITALEGPGSWVFAGELSVLPGTLWRDRTRSVGLPGERCSVFGKFRLFMHRLIS